MKPTDFARHLTEFLAAYLPGQQGASKNTIISYRDTFSLFLHFCKTDKGMRIERFELVQFKRKLIEEFLTWLEQERNNSISTRNQRLAAIHAFARFLQIEDTANIMDWQLILAIGFKKLQKPQINYLTADELRGILSKPNLRTSTGRRDLLLINMLYDTGARVSEIIDMKVRNVRIDGVLIANLHGKGNKMRQVPLMPKTAELLQNYLLENKLDSIAMIDHPLFFNSQRRKLTRPGVTYILQKYTDGEKITPHILRHTKAMHLLQAGVNLLYIRDILGHVDISTTETYVRADTEMKRKALENVYDDLTPSAVPAWDTDEGLMGWLRSLV